MEAVVKSVLTEAMQSIGGGPAGDAPTSTAVSAEAQNTSQDDAFRSVFHALDTALPQMLGEYLNLKPHSSFEFPD